MLTYAANADEYQAVSFWDRLDLIGLDAYFDMSASLPNPQPAYSQLRGAWESVLAGVEAWRIANQPSRQVLVTEIGFRSITDAQIRPWESWRAGAYDGRVQADCYQAAIEAWSGRSWVSGLIFWTWPSDLSRDIPNEAGNTGYSPYGKPAEQVLRAYSAEFAAADISQVRLWDGELHDSTDPATFLLNTMGGNPVQGIHATISYATDTTHTGIGAYQIRTNGQIPVSEFDYVGTALAGFGPNTQYVDTRDLTTYDRVEFWVRNQTGAPFSLTFEIKDYRDSNSHRAGYTLVVAPSPTWTKMVVPLDFSNGWAVDGSPDLSRAKLLSLVIKADRGQPVDGSVLVDDMTLIEPGGPVDPATAPAGQLAERVTLRQFDALWGSRDRDTGFLPTISSYADIVALNTTAGLVKMLPGAADRGWITRGAADACVSNVVATLGAMMDTTTYLPPRYADRVTLQPAYVREESPADAAMMFLALYQYQSLPTTSAALRDAIQAVLDRFNFQPFASPGGWKLAYLIDTAQFTAGAYDSYSGEPWLISLSADLSETHPVAITSLWNSATNRVADYLADPSLTNVVSTSTDLRAPYLQWLFPLFVDVAGRGVDSYPDPGLATNPLDNAVSYQRDVVAWFTELGRGALLQSDAGDDGSGSNYHEFSGYNDFGQSDLFMPWSVADVFLADPVAAEASLRTILASGLHGPFGLLDSAQWPAGTSEPSSATARYDLWNTTLSTMALVNYLYGNSDPLSDLPAVDAALDQVFPSSPANTAEPTVTISDVRVPSRGGVAVFQVTLSQAPTGPVDVQYFTVNATAVAGTDYTAVSGTLHLAAGQTTATISVPVSANATPELAETFYVDLAVPNGVTIADSRGVGTILNDVTPTAGLFTLEAERGVGGQSIMRSAASGRRTRLLQQGQSLTITWTSRGANYFQVMPIYSNDGGADTIRVEIDGQIIGDFVTADTRQAGAPAGSGWNRYFGATRLPASIARGTHRITITVLQSDASGVELDAVRFYPVLVGGGISTPVFWGSGTISVSMTGPGSAELIDPATPSALPSILLAGTTNKSLLTISSSSPVDLGEIYAASPIKGITAGRVTLRDDLTILGSGGNLAFAGVAAGVWDVRGNVGNLSIGQIQSPINLPLANLKSLVTSSLLVRAVQDGVPRYLVAIGEGGAIYPIRFASLAKGPKVICDYRRTTADPEPTSADILSAMTLASVKNHLVSSGLGAWKGDPSKLAPGLVASYAKTTDPNYKYVTGVSYVYDDALAVEALLLGTPDAERRARAFQIADALVMLQDRDPMNASAAPDPTFPGLRPAPLRDGYGAGTVATSRTATAVTVRNVGITTTSSGNQAYVAMSLLRAADVADSVGDAARAAAYRQTAKELLLYVGRNRLRPAPLKGFGLNNSPTIGTVRATEHSIDLASAFNELADLETDAALKAQWQDWQAWAETFRNAMYGPNERFGALAWISDEWSYFRAGTGLADDINKDLIPLDAGAWSFLTQGDQRDVPFDMLQFLSTSTDSKGRTYLGFDPGFRAVDDETLTSRRDGVGAEVTAYMVLVARTLGDTAVLAALPARASLTPDEQTAYDRVGSWANGGRTDHDLADALISQLANMQLYAPNTDGLGLVAAATSTVSTGENPLINGWSLASTCWSRLAYSGWNIFSDSLVA